MNAFESDVFWWLVSNGGGWAPICRQHADCLKAYPKTLQAAKRLAGGCGVWGSPMRGHGGRYDIEARYQAGRYYFRWIPHPELLEVEHLARDEMAKTRVPDDGGLDGAA